jgi:hypothetical protein
MASLSRIERDPSLSSVINKFDIRDRDRVKCELQLKEACYPMVQDRVHATYALGGSDLLDRMIHFASQSHFNFNLSILYTG